MGGSAAVRAKRLWLLAGGWLLTIYVSLYFVRAPVEALRVRGLLRPSVALIFGVVALAVVHSVFRRSPGRRELAVLLVFGLILLAVVARTVRPEERLHLLEYGALGGLIYSALLARRAAGDEPASHGSSGWRAALSTLRPMAGAILLTALAGWGDEGIQALLPNRVYDLQDVALNVAGGSIVVVAMACSKSARGWDRRAPASEV